MTMPTLERPASQLCTQSQFEESRYGDWCRRFGEEPCLHRKQWEFVYIAQALYLRGMLQPGKRGIGFGVGLEPVASLVASFGASALATDLAEDAGVWGATGQHATRLEDLLYPHMAAPANWRELLSFRAVDMNAIPMDLRQAQYDFAWSACSLDHLGSLSQGLDFIRASLGCVKPGGVVVHTTEYNISSNTKTLEQGPVVVYRDCDLWTFVREMQSAGHKMTLNLTRGDGAYDGVPDREPYGLPHLAMELGGFVITSVGLTIQKGGFS